MQTLFRFLCQFVLIIINLILWKQIGGLGFDIQFWVHREQGVKA